MAHVESIQHQTTVDANGARVFTTTIDFVRGIIADVNGNQVVDRDIAGAVDQDASKMTPSMELNKQSIATSTYNDPDRQSLEAGKVNRKKQ